MGERPCTVRKYASTLKTSAILVASLVGLWLGIIGQVSASTESERWVAPIPSAEDCGFPDNSIISRWGNIMWDYTYGGKYTLDEFKTAMNNLLTSPELINCHYGIDKGFAEGETVAHQAAGLTSVEGAKWAVSKGVDLTFTYDIRRTAYDDARIIASEEVMESLDFSPERRARAVKLPAILYTPPAPATESCAEVDGQTISPGVPVHEYCIVAENLQSSIETEVSQSLKRLIGVDYIYKAEKYLSGTALYPGYKATITFTCAPGIQDCGPAYVPGDRWSDNFLKLVKRTFGLSVKCSDSGNLLDVDSIEPGESVSVTHSSDTERSSPWYRNCEAISGGPFTLSIKTTRLARPPL